jgi:hypothetical protein
MTTEQLDRMARLIRYMLDTKCSPAQRVEFSRLIHGEWCAECGKDWTEKCECYMINEEPKDLPWSHE